jgi:pyridoxal phosphate enzyme (YggS family)
VPAAPVTPALIMSPITANLQAVRQRIESAAHAAGRPPGSVALVAVSKTFPAAAVRAAADAQQRDFGENYVHEGVSKVLELKALGLAWHYIGPIQSNKTRPIAEHFDWVHSVDRAKIAERLSQARPAESGDLQVCIQVNVSGESSKSGVEPGELAPLARQVAALPRLKLRGLMAVPEPTPDVGLQRQRFAQLRELRDRLNREGFALDTLSMGMSADLEAAIAEGATLVRVGTAIFGERLA